MSSLLEAIQMLYNYKLLMISISDTDKNNVKAIKPNNESSFCNLLFW
jgi:hypothetical protein